MRSRKVGGTMRPGTGFATFGTSGAGGAAAIGGSLTGAEGAAGAAIDGSRCFRRWVARRLFNLRLGRGRFDDSGTAGSGSAIASGSATTAATRA